MVKRISHLEKKAEKKSTKISAKDLLLEKFKSINKDGFVWYDLYKDLVKRHSFDQAVSELVKEHEITKIINGIFYVKPRKKPSMEDIANAIMLKNGFEAIKTDFPTLYLAVIPKTLKYNVCGQILTFKATSSRKLKIPKKIGKEAYFYLRIGGDEAFTPPATVSLVIPYVKRLADKLGRKVIVWTPADLITSKYVEILGSLPYCEVIHTHIFDGFDFLKDRPNFEFDCIITNGPFRHKRQWVEKAMSYKKPFALLLPATWLNDSAISQIFRNNDLQLLMPNKRTQFIRLSDTKAGAATFKAIYYCKDFLDRDIVQADI